MSRSRSFFLREAGECLADIESELGAPVMDVAAVHGAVRRFRGSAQMARFDDLARKAQGLEHRLRPGWGGAGAGSDMSEPGRGAVSGSAEGLRREVREVLTSLYEDVEAVREGRLEEDPRMEAGMEEQETEGGRGGADVVAIETLEYRGEAALERALELRSAIEEAVVSDEPAGPVLDELFDLIRLGAK